MDKPKLLFRDWIVEISGDPKSLLPGDPEDQEAPFKGQVIRAVNRALNKLTPRERDFAVRYYFQGQSLKIIAAEWGCRRTTVAGVYKRTVLRLKYLLADFVRKEFGLAVRVERDCPLCRSPFRRQINNLIKSKKKEETWKRIMGILQKEYGLKITTPQTLMGHRRYHLLQ